MPIRESSLRVKVDPGDARQGFAQLNQSLGRVDRSLADLNRTISKFARKSQQNFNQVNRSARRTTGAFSKLNKLLAAFGVGFSAALIVRGLQRLVSQARELSNEFEQSLTQIETLVGVNRETVQGWRGDILDLSVAAGRSAGELSKAQFAITSAGLRGAESMDVLEASAKGAAVGLGDTRSIALASVAALTAYGRENISAAQATETLFKTVREGNLEAAQLAPTLGRVIGIASELKVSFADVNAFIATVSRFGVPVEEAVTSLSSTLSGFLSTTEKQRKALARLGTSAEKVRQSLGEQGLAATLIDLTKAAAGDTETLGELIPNIRALRGVLAATGSQAEEYLRIQTSLREETNELDKGFERVQQTGAFASDQLNAAWEKLLITVGDRLAPDMLELSETLGDLAKNQEVIDFFTSLGTAVTKTAGFFAHLTEQASELRTRVLTSLKLTFIGPLALEAEEASQKISDLNAEAERLRKGQDPRRLFGGKLGGLAKARLREIKEEITTLRAAILESRREIKSYASTLDNLGETAKTTADKTGDVPPQVVTVGDSSKQTAETLKKLNDEFREAKTLATAAAAGLEEYRIVEVALGAGIDPATQLNDRMRSLIQTTAELNRLTERLLELHTQIDQAQIFARIAPTLDRPLDLNTVSDPNALPGEFGFATPATDRLLETVLSPEFLHDMVLAEAERISDELRKSEVTTASINRAWVDLATIAADAFSSLDDDLSAGLRTLSQMVAQFQQLKQLSASGVGGVQGFLGGAQFGGSVASLAQSFGVGGKFSGLGGSLGGGLGFLFGGPQGAQIGAFAGTLLGSLIKEGADEALATIRSVGVQIRLAEGDLGGAIRSFADGIFDTIGDIVRDLGGELGPNAFPDIKLKIREGVFSVMFEEFGREVVHRFESEAEAIDFAVRSALQRADITGISDNVRTVLQQDFESLAELGQALEFVDRIRFAAMDPFQAELVRLGEQFRRDAAAAERYGLSLREVREAFLQQLGDIGSGILSRARSAGGVDVSPARQVINTFSALREEARQLNQQLNAQIALEGARLSSLNAQIVGLKALVEGEAQLLTIRDKFLGRFLDVGRQMGLELPQLEPLELDREALQGDLAALQDAADATQEFIDSLAGQRVPLGQLGALEQQALDRVLADANRSLTEFTGSGFDLVSQMESVVDTATNLRETFSDLADAGLITAEEFARAEERIMGAGFGQQLQLVRDTANSFILDALNFLGRSEEAERFQFQLTQAEFQIRLAELDLAQQKLGLEIAAWETITGLAADIAAIDFEEWQRLQSPPVAAAQNIQRDFASAANDAQRIADALARANEGIQDLISDIDRGVFGGMTPEQSVNAGIGQLRELAAAARGGDLSARESFDDLAREVLRGARDAYGSTGRFQDILQEVRTLGQGVLDVSQVREENVVFDERFIREQTRQTAVLEEQHSRQSEMVEEIRLLRGDLAAVQSRRILTNADARRSGTEGRRVS